MKFVKVKKTNGEIKYVEVESRYKPERLFKWREESRKATV